ncbi:MAG TPA: hypothetical protein GX718_05650 [Brevibacterium sp.]|nr:hypothetical protein [Brevibacterium sp.]
MIAFVLDGEADCRVSHVRMQHRIDQATVHSRMHGRLGKSGRDQLQAKARLRGRIHILSDQFDRFLCRLASDQPGTSGQFSADLSDRREWATLPSAHSRIAELDKLLGRQHSGEFRE